MGHPSEKEFDLLVIGGGIHGASLAWEATLRGYSVALVEKGDFSSGASSGNYRIIHGGLRYLQHFDLIRLFESVEEQRIFRQIAPGALKPLPFIIPCYGSGMRGRELLHAGLTFYDLITFWRNQGVSKELHLPFHSLLSSRELLSIAPHLDSKGLRGGVVYFDLQIIDPDRLGLAFILSAARRGATPLNYTEVKFARISRGQIQEVVCQDVLTGESFSLRAKFIINSTGAWRESVAAKLLGQPPPTQFLFSKGLQVTLPLLTGSYAIALESKYRDKNAFLAKGNRSYFLQPWRGKTIAGTADILHTSEPDHYALSEEEVELFLEELFQLYPDPRINREQVVAVFGGLRPVSPRVWELHRTGALGRYGSIEVAHRDIIVVHREVRNLISVEGIKYTTTRRLAERVVDRFEQLQQEKRGESLSRVTPLDFELPPSELSAEKLSKMISSEFVRCPEDLLERRLGFGALEPPSESIRATIESLFSEAHAVRS